MKLGTTAVSIRATEYDEHTQAGTHNTHSRLAFLPWIMNSKYYLHNIYKVYLKSDVPKVIKKGEVSSAWNNQLLLFPPESFRNNWQIMQVPQLPACGFHVTVAAWFPHASTSVCTTEEEEVEIMKYRNLWKRGSFRKRACLTEIPRIMEKWQKGKHGKGIVKQSVTETCFFSFSLQESRFHREPPWEHKSPNVQN